MQVSQFVPVAWQIALGIIGFLVSTLAVGILAVWISWWRDVKGRWQLWR